jgi:hypothetical protein
LVEQKGGERREGEGIYLNKVYVWFSTKKKMFGSKVGRKEERF